MALERIHGEVAAMHSSDFRLGNERHAYLNVSATVAAGQPL